MASVASAVSIYRGVNSQIFVAGEPVIAVYAGAQSAIITNPYNAADQGLAAVEILYVDLINPAADQETLTTTPLLPGASIVIPATTENVTVNAASAGHRFSVVVVQPATPYPPTPPEPSVFPPSGPTSVLLFNGNLASYLYVEYQDDDDLQAFVASYNSIAQAYLNWFNQINLPVYTGAPIAGAILDWVGAGLYGVVRPALASGQSAILGPYNSSMYNQVAYDERVIVGPTDVVATSDDIYKRIITWNYFKGDGRVFNIRWLKRRIERFLFGTNGSAPPVNNTWQISVSFGVGQEVSIRLLTQERIITGGAILGACMYNSEMYNGFQTEVDFDFPPLPNTAIFKEAFDSQSLAVPFQFDFNVSVGT